MPASKSHARRVAIIAGITILTMLAAFKGLADNKGEDNDPSPCVVDDGGGCGRPCGPAWGTVLRVIDGDTIELTSGEKVRYLHVDTPETYKQPPECYSEEAKQFNIALIDGRTVALEYDEQCTDNYDRLLAFVCVDGRMVNKLLLERGYADLLIIPPNGKYKAEFQALKDAAQAESAGMWGACP